MEQAEWLKQFKLRASTGYTGAQNFNPYQALAMFSYNQTQAYDNWIGSHLMALPNDDLKWQKTQDYNIGFDLNLWGRLMIVNQRSVTGLDCSSFYGIYQLYGKYRKYGK